MTNLPTLGSYLTVTISADPTPLRLALEALAACLVAHRAMRAAEAHDGPDVDFYTRVTHDACDCATRMASRQLENAGYRGRLGADVLAHVKTLALGE